MITIAIDGYSACGKSSMAKELAKRLGYAYIDSGAMYRAVTLYCIENSIVDQNGTIEMKALEEAIPSLRIRFRYNQLKEATDTYLNDVCVEDMIRTLQVSNLVSFIAAVPEVRKAMVAQQQVMGTNKGIVMDGRDIGSVVFPKAELKIFVTASPEVRAQRRLEELMRKGAKTEYNDVLKNLIMRDKLDSERSDSPLVQCEDAYLLDNSSLTIKQQNDIVYELALQALQFSKQQNDCRD